MFKIDPTSTAGILLREHDNVSQALAYAERKFRSLSEMHNGMACDYYKAAQDLRAYASQSLPDCDYGEPWATFAC